MLWGESKHIKGKAIIHPELFLIYKVKLSVQNIGYVHVNIFNGCV